MQQIKVMTYNTHSCTGLDGKSSSLRVARLIHFHQPDVVALQEIDVNRRRSGYENQVAMIADALGMRHHYLPLIAGHHGTYGIALLARFPFQLIKAGQLTPGKPISKEPRGAVWIAMKVGGRWIHAINTHFGLSHTEKLEQLRVLAGPDWLGAAISKRRPMFLCGDFNSGPGSTVYRLLSRSLGDVQQSVAGYTPKCTFISMLPFIRIDHIFVRNFSVRQVKVPASPSARVASDHLPLLATLEAQC